MLYVSLVHILTSFKYRSAPANLELAENIQKCYPTEAYSSVILHKKGTFLLHTTSTKEITVVKFRTGWKLNFNDRPMFIAGRGAAAQTGASSGIPTIGVDRKWRSDHRCGLGSGKCIERQRAWLVSRRLSELLQTLSRLLIITGLLSFQFDGHDCNVVSVSY